MKSMKVRRQAALTKAFKSVEIITFSSIFENAQEGCLEKSLIFVQLCIVFYKCGRYMGAVKAPRFRVSGYREYDLPTALMVTNKCIKTQCLRIVNYSIS